VKGVVAADGVESARSGDADFTAAIAVGFEKQDALVDTQAVNRDLAEIGVIDDWAERLKVSLQSR
jgi:hypothetical protein